MLGKNARDLTSLLLEGVNSVEQLDTSLILIPISRFKKIGATTIM